MYTLAHSDFIIIIKREEEEVNWLEVPECQHITRTKCEFSLPNSSVFMETQFRVRAEEGNSTSSWNGVDPFIPFYKGKTWPPAAACYCSER